MRRRSPTSTVSVLPVPLDHRPGRGPAWFEEFEAPASTGDRQPLDAPYVQNGRTMLKIKHERTADVVVAGYREHKTSTPETPLVGSLLIAPACDGELRTSVSGSLPAARRAELIEELEPFICLMINTRWAEERSSPPPPTQHPPIRHPPTPTTLP